MFCARLVVPIGLFRTGVPVLVSIQQSAYLNNHLAPQRVISKHLRPKPRTITLPCLSWRKTLKQLMQAITTCIPKSKTPTTQSTKDN
jgi:hypothetical protein